MLKNLKQEGWSQSVDIVATGKENLKEMDFSPWPKWG